VLHRAEERALASAFASKSSYKRKTECKKSSYERKNNLHFRKKSEGTVHGYVSQQDSFEDDDISPRQKRSELLAEPLLEHILSLDILAFMMIPMLSSPTCNGISKNSEKLQR
jgi:hypothetical protein